VRDLRRDDRQHLPAGGRGRSRAAVH
jgi:hypothetical protein